MANSDEHDEAGYSNEEADNRRQQMEKRMQKLETCARSDMPSPLLYGPEKADVTIVSWGSNKGAILDALPDLPRTNFLHLNWINPFPVKAVQKVLSQAKYLINLEANFSGQMAGLIKEKTGIVIDENFLKYDGRPFYPEEIIKKIKPLL